MKFSATTQQYKTINSTTRYTNTTGSQRNSSLPEGDCNSIISKSPTDVGRTNTFQMDIPTAIPPIAHKPHTILLKYQKFFDEEIKLLENAGSLSKCLRPWAAPVIIVPKKPDH